MGRALYCQRGLSLKVREQGGDYFWTLKDNQPGMREVERTRRRRGKDTAERAYAITSLPPERADATRLLEIWRGHRGIENRLHWVQNVVFGEDLSQVPTESAPQLLAALRNLVIGMLRLGGVKNFSAALRHYG